MREKIFAMLLAAKDYLSGEEISQTLGISRAAVWKHIKALQNEGYQIEGIRKKGYRLLANGLHQEEIAPFLNTKWLGQEQQFWPEVGSTNDIAKKAGDETAVNGLVVFADQQTAGRGRLGRPWSSPAGEGIWFSLLLRPPLEPSLAPQLTLATAVGIAQGLRELGFTAGIKWPNDIFIKGKKLCGILTEMRADMDRINWVVIGCGINALTKEFPPELQSIATSLALEQPRQPVIRAKVAATILNHLEATYELLYQKGFAPIRQQWLDLTITLGKEVKVQTVNQLWYGTAQTMTPEGHLVVKLADGTERTVISGDVMFS